MSYGTRETLSLPSKLMTRSAETRKASARVAMIMGSLVNLATKSTSMIFHGFPFNSKCRPLRKDFCILNPRSKGFALYLLNTILCTNEPVWVILNRINMYQHWPSSQLMTAWNPPAWSIHSAISLATRSFSTIPAAETEVLPSCPLNRLTTVWIDKNFLNDPGSC